MELWCDPRLGIHISIAKRPALEREKSLGQLPRDRVGIFDMATRPYVLIIRELHVYHSLLTVFLVVTQKQVCLRCAIC